MTIKEIHTCFAVIIISLIALLSMSWGDDWQFKDVQAGHEKTK